MKFNCNINTLICNCIFQSGGIRKLFYIKTSNISSINYNISDVITEIFSSTSFKEISFIEEPIVSSTLDYSSSSLRYNISLSFKNIDIPNKKVLEAFYHSNFSFVIEDKQNNLYYLHNLKFNTRNFQSENYTISLQFTQNSSEDIKKIIDNLAVSLLYCNQQAPTPPVLPCPVCADNTKDFCAKEMKDCCLAPY